jgi:hypothetical protein
MPFLNKPKEIKQERRRFSYSRNREERKKKKHGSIKCSIPKPEAPFKINSCLQKSNGGLTYSDSTHYELKVVQMSMIR